MNEQRPYKFTLSLTDKENRRLAEYAQKHKMPRQNIMIQALRVYDAIESGNVILSPTAASSEALAL